MSKLNSILKDCVVFFDFDGVLAPYQATESLVHIDQNEYVTRAIKVDDMYSHLTAPVTMTNLIAGLDNRMIYLLSTAPTSFEQNQKRRFLEEHYPKFLESHMIFVADDDYKVQVINALYSSGKLKASSKSKVVMIDDTVEILSQVERLGYKAYHISSVMD